MLRSGIGLYVRSSANLQARFRSRRWHPLRAWPTFPPRRTVSSGNDSCRPVRKGMSQMQIRFIRALLVVAVSVAVYGGTARATPPSRVTRQVLARGQFDAIHTKTLSHHLQ